MVPHVFRRNKGQGSPEFIVVISFVMLIFVVIMVISIQKQKDAYDMQVFLDAKRVAASIGDNINMIAKNGDGYYKYFSIPEYLHGFTDYNITLNSNFLEIAYMESNWASPLITDNVSIVHLDKGGGRENCVISDGGLIILNNICNSSNLACGTVHTCDPGDNSTCPTCDTGHAGINQNSLSYCQPYGCATSEWHLYELIPDRDGTLKITFTGSGTMIGENKTDLIFYDYTTNACTSPQQTFQLEPVTVQNYAVFEGRTYIIGLDVDSTNCSQGGSYTLRTELL